MNKEEKTLSYLNEKVWFRLLKVVFIFTYIIIGIVGTVLIWIQTEPFRVVDNTKTYIQCNYGNNKKLIAQDIDLHFTYSDFKDGKQPLLESHKNYLIELCQISDETYRENILAKIRAYTNSTTATPLFQVVPVYKLGFSEMEIDSPFVNSFFGYLIILAATFFIIKYTFYYVLTGNILPKP